MVFFKIFFQRGLDCSAKVLEKSISAETYYFQCLILGLETGKVKQNRKGNLKCYFDFTAGFGTFSRELMAVRICIWSLLY